MSLVLAVSTLMRWKYDDVIMLAISTLMRWKYDDVIMLAISTFSLIQTSEQDSSLMSVTYM